MLFATVVVISENLVYQKKIPQLMNLFILVTCLLDIVMRILILIILNFVIAMTKNHFGSFWIMCTYNIQSSVDFWYP